MPLQIFAFSYAILAGLRGVLFSILNLRLMQRLRCELWAMTFIKIRQHLQGLAAVDSLS